VTGPLAIAIGGQDRLFPTACYFDDNPACSFFYDVHHGTVNTMCEGNTIDGPYVPSHLSAGPHSVYLRLVSVHDAHLSVPCLGPFSSLSAPYPHVRLTHHALAIITSCAPTHEHSLQFDVVCTHSRTFSTI
jgi:hypothetical protein